MKLKEDEDWKAKKEKSRVLTIANFKKPQQIEMDVSLGRRDDELKIFEKKRELDLQKLIQKYKNQKNEQHKKQKEYLTLAKNSVKTKTVSGVPGSTKKAST